MTDREVGQDDQPETLPDGLERAQTTAADVESAGRSCIVILALAIVILVLLGVWVLYTSS